MLARASIPAALMLLAAPGQPPARRPFRERELRGPRLVVVRTRDDMIVGTSLSYRDGVFRVQDAESTVEVPEADLVRAVFLPDFAESGRNPVAGLAVRVARAEPLRAPKGPDPGDLLRRVGGIFLPPEADPKDEFTLCAGKLKQPWLIALLCYELVEVSDRRGRLRTAADLLEAAETRLHDDLGRAFVYALMREALAIRLRAVREPRGIREKLLRRYPDHEAEVRQFFAQLFLGAPPRRDGPPPAP